MGTDEEVLPEPFSEKNIDGTPLWGASNGGSLFKAASTDLDRRHGERRVSDRRNIPYEPQPSPRPVTTTPVRPSYQAPPQGEQNIYSAEAQRHENLRAASMSYNDGYGQASSYTQETTPAAAPAPAPTPAFTPASADIPVAEPEYTAAKEPAATVTATINSTDDDYGYSTSFSDNGGDDDYGYSISDTSGTDTDDYGYGFEPPVDEKPGMIPNPMKMPPVKVKSSLDYDYDYDTDIGADDGYDYDYNAEAPSSASATPSSDFFGFGGGDSDYGSSDIGADDDYGMDIDIDDDDDYR